MRMSSPMPEVQVADVPVRPQRARPLRILQVSHDLQAGGLQRVVVDLAQGLKRLGHEAHICSLRGTGPLAPWSKYRSPGRISKWDLYDPARTESVSLDAVAGRSNTFPNAGKARLPKPRPKKCREH